MTLPYETCEQCGKPSFGRRVCRACFLGKTTTTSTTTTTNRSSFLQFSAQLSLFVAAFVFLILGIVFFAVPIQGALFVLTASVLWSAWTLTLFVSPIRTSVAALVDMERGADGQAPRLERELQARRWELRELEQQEQQEHSDQIGELIESRFRLVTLEIAERIDPEPTPPAVAAYRDKLRARIKRLESLIEKRRKK